MIIGILALAGCSQFLAQTKLAAQQPAAVVLPTRAEQRVNELAARLDRIEAAMKDLKQQIANLEATQNSATSQLTQKFSKLETSLRDLTGVTEEANHASVQVNQRIDRLNLDYSFRLDRLDKLMAGVMASISASDSPAAPNAAPNAATSAGVPTISPSPGQKTVVPKPELPPTKGELASANKILTQANDAYAKGKLDRAQTLLEAYIEDNPGHPNLSEAIFTLGKVYFDNRQFENAASRFFTTYEKYPRSASAPESLYRLGLTLRKLDRKVESCSALAQLSVDYPKADKALLTKAAAARDRYKCR